MIIIGMSNLYIMVDLKTHMYVNMFIISHTTIDFIDISKNVCLYFTLITECQRLLKSFLRVKLKLLRFCFSFRALNELLITEELHSTPE